jgi:hypothetical protein
MDFFATAPAPTSSLLAPADVEELISKVADSLGLNTTVTIVPCSFGDKVEAMYSNGAKNAQGGYIRGPEGDYIIYNPIWFREVVGQDYAQTVAVFAHELAHLLNRDFVAPRVNLPRKTKELEADRFAGCAVAKMKVSLASYESLLSRIRPDLSGSYPSKDESIAAARKAYTDCGGAFEAAPDPMRAIAALDLISARDWSIGDGNEILRRVKDATDIQSLYKAAETDARAQLVLAQYYWAPGQIITEAEAFDLLEKSAAAGNARAMNFLGVLYENRRTIADCSRAFSYLEKASKKKNGWGQYNFGMIYIKAPKNNGSNGGGIQFILPSGQCIGGVSYNYRKGINLLKKAAKQGHVEAANFLITMGEDW